MEETITIRDREKLSDWLSKASNEGKIVQTTLAASERVIARVTDGIYREPASALRELISNAWDADASNVTILTDAPRFSRIYVRDNGNGMSYQTLARLLKNIGGSAKRREEGKGLGVTASSDPEKTPGGRQLIGKIGIGLFSVSQLARKFRIITKSAGNDYRLLAEVRLRAYSDNTDEDVSTEDSDNFITGEVFIRREASKEISAHGTDIILDDIKRPVREILRSADRWKSVAEKYRASEDGDLESWASMRVTAPSYHSGYIDNLKEDILTVSPILPWDVDDDASVRMAKLVEAVESETSRLDRPELATSLDTYLSMIWSLGLSAPVSYVYTHPFDLKQHDDLKVYWITRERSKGLLIELKAGETVRTAVEAQAPGNPKLIDGIDPVGGFKVELDGVELRRPISFKHRQTERRGLQNSALFVGRFSPDLKKISSADRGGNLGLEGYVFWTGRVVPKENNGVLIRIRGASGALFDPTFFKYQVAEQTRLRQLTSELFVQTGLDAALNIDRESFNFAHPHLQLVTLWLHGAIRQLTNRLKDDASRLREIRKQEEALEGIGMLERNIGQVWSLRRGLDPLPEIAFAENAEEAAAARRNGYFAITKENFISFGSPAERTLREGQVSAVVRVLAAFGIMDDRPYEEQQNIVRAIMGIFLGDAG